MRRWLAAFIITLLLNGCGYHLVGHGDGEGAIPADVATLSLIVAGSPDRMLEQMLRQRLNTDKYALINQQAVIDQQNHANLRIILSPVSYIPSAYDVAGVATQYRMTLSGSLILLRQGKSVWKSGLIQRQGDVYVTGGPTSIEASRERLLEDLRKLWVSDAIGRLRSGF